MTADNRCSAGEHERQRRADGAACLEAALEYLTRHGLSVLAVCPPDHMGVGRQHGKSCSSPGKAPWGTWKGFQDRLPTEAELRRKWRDNPTLNVGCALGPVSGLVRVDVDGPAGEAKLLALSGGDLPITWEFDSGRDNGGRGLLYRIPPGVKVATTGMACGKGEELRFQAKGAQTVLPPSRHPDGLLYRWRPGRAPGEIDAAPMPTWLIDRLRTVVQKRQQLEHTTINDGVFQFGAATAAAVRAAIAGSLPSGERQRNGALFVLARRLKSIPGFAGADVDAMRPHVREWHRRALPFIRTKPFQDSWSDFGRAWLVAWPITGSAVAIALEHALESEPDIARRYADPRMRLLVSVCWHLQHHRGDKPFFLSSRDAAQALGIPGDNAHRDAWRLLRDLEDDGVLFCSDRGTPGVVVGGKAAAYRFVGLRLEPDGTRS